MPTVPLAQSKSRGERISKAKNLHWQKADGGLFRYLSVTDETSDFTIQPLVVRS